MYLVLVLAFAKCFVVFVFLCEVRWHDKDELLLLGRQRCLLARTHSLVIISSWRRVCVAGSAVQHSSSCSRDILIDFVLF